MVSTQEQLLQQLRVGEVHGFVELAELMGFEEGYLQRAGGMIPRRALDVLMLITHSGGGRSFDYEDYWDGEDLVYTGRGQEGDQKLDGANRDVAENRRPLLLFEGAGPRMLRYLGRVTAKEWWWGDGPDKSGHSRRILRFRLRLLDGDSPLTEAIEGSKFFGGGESEAHRLLKERVAADPTLVGLPSHSRAEIEHRFRSPDRADVVLRAPDGRSVAVEVELAGELNTLVGAWQAIKYRTLLCLELGVPLGSDRAAAVLVAHSVGKQARKLCAEYGVEWHEVS